MQSANVGPMVVTVEGSLDSQEGERLHCPVNIMQLYELSRTLPGTTLCDSGRSPMEELSAVMDVLHGTRSADLSYIMIKGMLEA